MELADISPLQKEEIEGEKTVPSGFYGRKEQDHNKWLGWNGTIGKVPREGVINKVTIFDPLIGDSVPPTSESTVVAVWKDQNGPGKVSAQTREYS